MIELTEYTFTYCRSWFNCVENNWFNFAAFLKNLSENKHSGFLNIYFEMCFICGYCITFL